MGKTMTKIEAVEQIITDSRSDKLTRAGLKRVRQAAAVLGLGEVETARLETLLEYRGSNGEYHEFLEPVHKVDASF